MPDCSLPRAAGAPGSRAPADIALGRALRLVRGRDGWIIANENDAYVGRSMLRYGEFSPDEQRFLAQPCKPSAILMSCLPG
jgi:hypothetical protein